MMPSLVRSNRELSAVDAVPAAAQITAGAPLPRPVWIPWSVAAVCLLIALMLGALYATEKTRRIVAEQQESIAETSLAQMRSVQSRADSLLTTLLVPNLLTTVMSSTESAGTARVFYNQAGHELVLALFDLPPAPEGRTYRLWGSGANRRIDLGPIQPAPGQRVIVRVKTPPGEVLKGAFITLSENSPSAPLTEIVAARW